MRGYCVQKAVHHGEIHHGAFVHYHEIGGYGVAPGAGGVPSGGNAQEAVEGSPPGFGDALGHSGGGASGGGGEGRSGGGKPGGGPGAADAFDEAGGGGGFSGSRAAGEEDEGFSLGKHGEEGVDGCGGCGGRRAGGFGDVRRQKGARAAIRDAFLQSGEESIFLPAASQKVELPAVGAEHQGGARHLQRVRGGFIPGQASDDAALQSVFQEGIEFSGDPPGQIRGGLIGVPFGHFIGEAVKVAAEMSRPGLNGDVQQKPGKQLRGR